MAVVIETTVGDITVDLYVDRRPQTCKNFLKLCKIKYYNFCLFHSIQSNFLAQTGDPTGSGTGGESVFGIVYGEPARFFEAELMPKIKHSKPGLLSMVNCGNNMLGSQFFVTLGADLQSLDEHCVFAEVVDGHDVLLKLNSAICDNQHRPYMDIRITHTVILQDPFDDPSGLLIPEMSPEPVHSKLANGRIGADEKIDETEGLTAAEVEELKQEREAKARATILEIVGDLPDAEMAPPENVLFVCKLNPVTNDDDLQTLFSRFGKVKSCEVIRDPKSGDSLQYAFVEFEDKRSCEAAYFKMDNVLIDDRRIHVDFSQSVAKMRWRGKGRGVEHFDKDPGKERAGSSSYRAEESRSHSSSRRDHYQDRDRRHHSWDADDKRRRRDGDGDRYKSDWRKNDRRRDDRRREDWREDNSKKVEDGRRYEDGSKRRDHEDPRKRDDDTRKRDDDSRRNEGRRKDERKTDDKRRDNKRGSDKKKDNDKYQREKKNNEDRNEKKEKDSRKVKDDYNESNDQFKEDVIGADYFENNTKAEEVELEESFIEKTDLNFGIIDKPLSTNYHEGNDETSSHKEIKEKTNDDIKHRDLNQNHDSHKSEQETSKKLKRKRENSESKYRRKKRNSSSSDSSSESSDSSDSSSSSDSVSSNYKYKGKHKMIVAKKYYQGGKLVKEIKKKRRHDTSDSESLSEDSSDSEYKKKKKGKKRKKVIVKIIKKRKKKMQTTDDSESVTSSTDNETERKTKKKKRKEVDKYMKKKRKHVAKKKKRRRSDHSSNSSDSESSDKKKNGNKKIKKHIKEGSHHPGSE